MDHGQLLRYYSDRGLDPEECPNYVEQAEAKMNFTPQDLKSATSILKFAIRYHEQYQFLHPIINSHAVKKRRFELKAAQISCWDRHVSKVLRLAGAGIDRPAKFYENKNGFRIFFGFGQVDFADNTSTATFNAYMIKKLLSLGHKILFLDEYYTSQKCPCCHGQTTFTGSKGNIRVKYCHKCDIYFHRDLMAALNITNVMVAELKGEFRPKYLQSPYQKYGGPEERNEEDDVHMDPPAGAGGVGEEKENEGGPASSSTSKQPSASTKKRKSKAGSSSSTRKKRKSKATNDDAKEAASSSNKRDATSDDDGSVATTSKKSRTSQKQQVPQDVCIPTLCYLSVSSNTLLTF